MPHLFLYGPPGTGKSTIGRLLADKLRLPFIDLDRLIESQAGMSIPQIMEQQGEAAFRELETTALNSLTLTPLPLGEGHRVRESVIALGGGALLRGENRAVAEASGKVVLLTAEMETLLERLSADPEKRPLLAGDLREKLTTLLETRKEHYASFPLQLRVDGKSAEQIARQIQIIVGRHHLSAMGEYDVVVGQTSSLSASPNSILVTDENVAKHHLEKFQGVNAIVLPAGEEHKNLETVSRLWRAFLKNGLDRKSTVIALGGGVVSDLTGFAASTYMRGIDWIALPTTLLAMVDASLGGKTGIDLPEGKNLIGSFHPPKLVLADPSLLLTLSDRDLRSGMAEVVKHGVISDPELFDLCSRGMDWVKANLETIVKRAMAVKIQVIEADPYEKGIRASLNLGHTVGHAVELVSRFALSHGEAVAIGMAVEARYAEKIGVARRGLADTIAETLSTLGLPTRIPEGMPLAEIIRVMRVDKKKNAAAIRFALPTEIGRVELVEVTELEEVIGNW
ncbi:MAG: 3-dehydroquinate synthase [Chloroflexota bacterium]|jgi:3-dehydroquinate synthase